MYHVVVPIDGERERAENATDYLIGLIDDEGLLDDPGHVTVSLVNVFKEFRAVDEGGNVRSDDLYDETAVPDSVTEARARLEAAGFDVDLVRRHGDPAEEILEYVEAVDADAIVVPARKRSTVGKAVFGSVAQEVILGSERPVTVV
ncbi:universal stress protein [Natronorarus salvus]|uniref:universal stress protein n=1 Tax=Natronorarus salvus TaxID=3117733 RepID=UPI002F2659D2